MSEEQEREHWRKLICELQEVMTIAAIAEEVQAQDRQVWRWKNGEDRPLGMKAVRVYLLHVKRCPVRQCPEGHVQAQ